MAITVFTLNEFSSIVSRGDRVALDTLLVKHPELTDDAELMLEGMEKAIIADMGKGTHLGLVEDLLKFPSVNQNLLQEENRLLRKAIVFSPIIARKLIAINSVADAIRNDPKCELLRQSLIIAGLIEQRSIVCEVSELVQTSSVPSDSLIQKSALLTNIVGAQRARIKDKYKTMEKIFVRVPTDVGALIFSFLPRSNPEREAITLKELQALFPSKPYVLNNVSEKSATDKKSHTHRLD